MNDEEEEADRTKEKCGAILPCYLKSYYFKCIFPELKAC